MFSRSPLYHSDMVEYLSSSSPILFPAAERAMESHVALIRSQRGRERLWFLEHPPCYTAGRSACDRDLLDCGGLPVYQTGRGGLYTYHGPGQRVIYVMLNIHKRGRDIRALVHYLELWLIRVLGDYGVKGERRSGRIGIWVCDSNGMEEKIAAIGLRIRHGITFHGVSLNICPNLDHFSGIHPCGIRDYGVTSLEKRGVDASFSDIDFSLRTHFTHLFGPVEAIDSSS